VESRRDGPEGREHKKNGELLSRGARGLSSDGLQEVRTSTMVGDVSDHKKAAPASAGR
jgi:hypothetical protein